MVMDIPDCNEHARKYLCVHVYTPQNDWNTLEYSGENIWRQCTTLQQLESEKNPMRMMYNEHHRHCSMLLLDQYTLLNFKIRHDVIM